MPNLRVLNVAEKPSVAKQISQLLSGGAARYEQTSARYNGLYKFQYDLHGQTCAMTFTSVSGHLMELDFPSSFKSWRACEPSELFSAPISKLVPQDKHELRHNLETQSRQNQWLILWLDCDREGENIAFEVLAVCTRANSRLMVKRARFSALILHQLQHALASLVAPDQQISAAVDARQEIDLRTGAAFTRFQTLLLQDKYNWREFASANGKPKLLSYGPCQFPTLGLIVQRTWEIQAHQPEPFWSLALTYTPPERPACSFTWARERVFDKEIGEVLFETCLDAPDAIVVESSGAIRQRQPPLPLNTLELQKKAVTYLRMSSDRVMKVAEELYQAGFISYPRTETDEFEGDYNLQAMIEEHTQDPRWGSHAARIIDGAMWKQPSSGGHNDHAHPPIHPTKHSTGEAGWTADKGRLYELVARCFLATCSRAAVGRESRVVVEVARETFQATGLIVTERNWLEVFPYTTWGGASQLPDFQPGQVIAPNELRLREGMSQPPSRMTERELISLMDSHGIGTDATVAEHIHKQLDRQYATLERANMTFWPTPLGEALVSGYRKMDLQNLWLPDLRSKIELSISKIACGQDSKAHVVSTAIAHFRQDMQAAVHRQRRLEPDSLEFVLNFGVLEALDEYAIASLQVSWKLRCQYFSRGFSTGRAAP